MLPSGYQKLTDPSTGRPYYVNLVTGQTSWSPPAGAEAAPAPAAGGAGGIEERIDPSTGRTFYIDHANKRTTWEDPRQPSASAAAPSEAHRPSLPRPAPASAASGAKDDAELARELAAQWEAEDEAEREEVPRARTGGSAATAKPKAGKPKEWADDATCTNCFLTDVKFTMVQRKHHCRYCGQIFVSDVCRKTATIPGKGSEAVRVCDVCFDQLERGDPICICKQVSLLRSDSESDRQQGAKELANWASMDPQFAVPGVVTALQALGLTELLTGLLRSSSATTQAAAANLLAKMLAYEEYREMLQDQPLLESLLSAVRSNDVKTKTTATSTLAAITSSVSGRSQLRAAGGLLVLLDVLLSAANEALQEACCLVLANLCEDGGEDWKQMLQAGAVFTLVQALSSSSVGLQEATLTLLAMLCSHSECREQLADSGALPFLSTLLGSPKRDVQRAALATCQQLCGSRRACDAMLEAGAASPLAAMLLSSSAGGTEVVSALLDCLAALSESGLAQAQRAVRNVGAVPHLIQLMNHPESRVARVATSLVSSLCPGDVHNAEQLFESGGLVLLADSLASRDERAQLQAASALSQLSSDPVQAAAIVDNGCLLPLLGLLEHTNQELKAYAAITFGNLCTGGCLSPAQLQHPTVLPHLVAMLSSSNALAKGPAATAIASMAADPTLRSSLYELGGLPGLAALLNSDAETSYHAVQAIAQFAADERYRHLLPEAGAVPPLAALLPSHLPHVQQCALSAVANLSFVHGAVGPLCASGALTHVGQMLFSPDARVQSMCLTTLCNLLHGSAGSAEALLQVGGHMALLTQLSSPSPDVQSQAAMALGHMCRSRSAVQALVQADAVPLLAQLLHSPHPAVQLQAVYALGVLAAEDEAAANAVQLAGAVAPLTTLLLSSSSPDVKRHLTLTLAHAARGNWRPVFNVGGFQALLDVLAVGTGAVQQDVSATIAALVEDVHQRRALLADMNSISAIVGLLSSPDEGTQQHAASALAALAEEASARETLYRLGTLSHIIRSLSAANSRAKDAPGADAPAASAARISMVRVVAAFAADPRYCDMLRITIQPLVAMVAQAGAKGVLPHAARALTSLSHSEPNRDALREAGAQRRMAELLLHAESGVQASAVQCVANLGVDATDAKAFMDAGWHLALIQLLSAPAVEVQGAAAAVLGNLSAVPEFRVALMADGALRPILELLQAAELPARTAATRALAIMSQQLMSPELAQDDPNAKLFVDSFFEANALPSLLQVLSDEPAANVDAYTSERQVVAILLLLQNLSAGNGLVRPRLVAGGAVEGLLRFLSHRADASRAEILDTAVSTLALLMLSASGLLRLEQGGGIPVLVKLLRSASPAAVAPAARAAGNLLREDPPPALVAAVAPALLHALGRTSAASSLDVLYALTNLFGVCPAALAGEAAGKVAAGLVRVSQEPEHEETLHAAVSLMSLLALQPHFRKALHDAGAVPALRPLAAGGWRGPSLLLGMLTAEAHLAANGRPQAQTAAHTAALPPPPQPLPHHPPAYALPADPHQAPPSPARTASDASSSACLPPPPYAPSPVAAYGYLGGGERGPPYAATGGSPSPVPLPAPQPPVGPSPVEAPVPAPHQVQPPPQAEAPTPEVPPAPPPFSHAPSPAAYAPPATEPPIVAPPPFAPPPFGAGEPSASSHSAEHTAYFSAPALRPQVPEVPPLIDMDSGPSNSHQKASLL